jgi:hypothetical protein
MMVDVSRQRIQANYCEGDKEKEDLQVKERVSPAMCCLVGYGGGGRVENEGWKRTGADR